MKNLKTTKNYILKLKKVTLLLSNLNIEFISVIIICSFNSNNLKWWQNPDLNRGHEDFQSSALPTELFRQNYKLIYQKIKWRG